ncbi:hypothetical protein EIK77_007913 [Talaromyces pinophilus]|nr:hypothetical protein EIK77_007913 [Talaromyces pinophilus]
MHKITKKAKYIVTGWHSLTGTGVTQVAGEESPNISSSFSFESRPSKSSSVRGRCYNMSRSKLVLQHQLLPIENVSLGRFITDIDFPQRQFHNPFPNMNEINSTVFIQRDVTEILHHEHSTAIGGNITELLQLFRGKYRNLGTQVQATASATYEMQQWEIVFKKACSLTTTRKWMETAIEEDKPVFFIVGYRTFINPSLTETADWGGRKSIQIQMPVSSVVEANLLPPLVRLGNVLDPSVGRAKDKAVTSYRSYNTDGEVVYAVQYCRVKFKWFSSNKVGSSSLGPTRWKVHWGVRDAQEMDEDDIIEAELVEDSE